MRLPGQIVRDSNGVAHIRAFTDFDLAFLNGWMHAEDRLFEMDENRRTANGTLAELVGPAALPTDIQLRTLGLSRAAVLSSLEYPPRVMVEQARAAEEAGADCLLILPPNYPNADPEGMHNYYKAIADSVGIGVMIYARDWVVMTPAAVKRLADEIPNLIAFKDGQGDVRNFKRIKRHVGDRLLWLSGVGDDMVDDYFAAGAEGYTSSLSNLMPQLSYDLYAAASQGRTAELQKLMHGKVYPLYELRGKRKGYEVSTSKTAMARLGMPAGPVRPPLVELTADERQQMAATLDQVGLRQAAASR
jgi:5-dehydro-4-deoxyglucarate dehydratase